MNNIPKIIHYCWFGKKPHNDLIIKCINSWKRYLPDYKIVEWNEDNFDINCNEYVKEAYIAKKYAFVSDYVRLYVLYNYGGIYMDTDVEVIRNLDVFLSHYAFSGFENDNYIPTAIMGSREKNTWIKKLLDYYDYKHFQKDDGSYDLTTNVVTITNITQKEFGVSLNSEFFEINELLTIYPKEYFCPKSYETGKILLTKNTYTIHHFNGSWLDEHKIKDRKNNYKIVSIFGEKLGWIIISVITVYKKEGLYNVFNRIIKKLI
ncbi:glycosyltransferase family 32 protein [Neobacillus drentensis]|uniref:glycosyltransferase family 32 protein n=1 Tax=Neobacillus drentensis TaxID=220684 RepID=UPI002FFFFE10